jgi:hypothetical protein
MRYLLLLLLFPLMLGGCALLDGSVRKAHELAELRQGEMNAAYDAWRRATVRAETLQSRLTGIQLELEEARKKGNKNEIAALLLQLEALKGQIPDVQADVEAAQEAFKASEKLLGVAVQDFKDAQSASDYIGTVLGWLLALVGAGGVGVQTLGKRKLAEGLDTTFRNTAKALTPEQLDALKKLQAESMPATVKKAVEKVAG